MKGTTAMQKIHLYKVILTRNNVKKKVMETSDMPQARMIAQKWKNKYPDHQVLILGSLYHVYEVL